MLPSTPLVLVTGKGGVGRSSAATALAVALAAGGARVALVHPAGAPGVAPPAGAPRGLRVISLDRAAALSAYLSDHLPGPLAAGLRASRVFGLITAATPGVAELITIGELQRLLGREVDRIVFDAPATGHLLAMLDAPGRFERAAAAGPIAARARNYGEWIADPAVTSAVTVTTGDGLAVSEVLDLAEVLAQRLGRGPELVIANRLAPASPPAAELAALEATGPQAAPLLALAARARSERAQLGRITKALGHTPVRAEERPGDALGALAEALGTVASGAGA